MAGMKAEFTFSPRILEHLGISAYNSVRKCLAELVANSYDADAHRVDISIPDVVDENSSITLSDDGTGMSPEDIKTKFLYIGRDRREDGDRTCFNRLVIGSKGIGKLAGFGISSRIRITTRHDGKLCTFTIDRRDLDSIQELTEHKFDVAISETELKNGTTLELLQLHEGLHLPSAEVVRRHLYHAMPSRPDFAIFVNDGECSAEEVPGELSKFAKDIPAVGQVTGFYVIAKARQSSPGLAVRVRGRIVQEPSLFGLDTRSHGFFTSEKIAGEINAEFLDPESPDGNRHDLIKTSRDGFLEDSEIVQKFNIWAAEFIKQIIVGVDVDETRKRTDNLLQTPVIKSKLDSLPPHIRGTASKVVRACFINRYGLKPGTSG